MRTSVRGLAAGATAALLSGSMFLGPVTVEAAAIYHHPRTSAAPTTDAGWVANNWSGYAKTGTYTSVTAEWVVPSVARSPKPTFSSQWVGIDGFDNGDLIQTGTEADYYNGSAHYAAWWEILPAAATVIPSITVRPGDQMSASITKGFGQRLDDHDHGHDDGPVLHDAAHLYGSGGLGGVDRGSTLGRRQHRLAGPLQQPRHVRSGHGQRRQSRSDGRRPRRDGPEEQADLDAFATRQRHGWIQRLLRSQGTRAARLLTFVRDDAEGGSRAAQGQHRLTPPSTRTGWPHGARSPAIREP